jgi:hypothetical protein
MSRGFGKIEMWLLGCIGTEPMTFKQIFAIAYPVGTYEGDLAAAIGGSNVGGIRSLRRALGRLVDQGVIQGMGRRPLHYRLAPVFVRKRIEHKPELIRLVHRIIEAEAKEATP